MKKEKEESFNKRSQQTLKFKGFSHLFESSESEVYVSDEEESKELEFDFNNEDSLAIDECLKCDFD